MKVILICVLIFAFSASATAEDDPFAATSRVLPQEHSHATTPAVPPLTLAELERIANHSAISVRCATMPRSALCWRIAQYWTCSAVPARVLRTG